MDSCWILEVLKHINHRENTFCHKTFNRAVQSLIQKVDFDSFSKAICIFYWEPLWLIHSLFDMVEDTLRF